MERLELPTDEQLAETRRLLDQYINDGGDKFRVEIRMLRDERGWQWLPRKPAGWFNRTAVKIMSAYSYYRYQRMGYMQLHDGSLRFWIWRTHTCEQPGHERLDGLTLPRDHAFWLRQWPPLDAECSCTVGGSGTAAGVARMGGNPEVALPEDWETWPISFGSNVLDFRGLVLDAISRAEAEPI